MAYAVYRRLSAEQPPEPSARLGVRLRLGLRRRRPRRLALARLVGAGDPATPARAQLLEQLCGIAGNELDLVRAGQLRLDPVGRLARATPRAQLLDHVQ